MADVFENIRERLSLLFRVGELLEKLVNISVFDHLINGMV